MVFEVEMVGGFNPFEWDALKCPMCGGNKFGSLSHSAIYCDSCNARFEVRYTGGDPGCVIDCFVKEKGTSIYAPSYRCVDCDMRFGSMDEEPKCPCGVDHTVERREGVSTPIQLPDDHPERFCLVLKIGDYCSRWMPTNETGPLEYLDHPTQDEWDEYSRVEFGFDD